MYIIFHYKKSTHIWISPNSSRLCSISIIIFLFSFQALRQTRQQSRHLRIAKYFHQQFGIYSLRYGNLIFFLFLLMYIRIKIFLIIKGILHKLRILPSVFIKDMTIHFRYHVRLCMSGISLDCFDISTAQFQLVCNTCMVQTMKNHYKVILKYVQ